tara:strand:- start:547 stop:1323 length:777 start_codon:yes stop_codon:yes gene_type:complete
MSKVFVKAVAPHRQKVLQGDKEFRLQQVANRMMADQMRQGGQSPTGDMFTQGRDKLMRDMVMNPEAHNIKFLGERVPFEGQTLGSSLSEPDVAGEQAAIDAEFRDGDIHPKLDDGDPKVQQWQSSKDPSEPPTPKTAQDKLLSEILDEKGNLKPDNQFMDMEEDDMHDEALADWEARQDDIDFARKEGHTEGFEGKPYHEIEQEELNADKENFYAKFPHLKPKDDDRPQSEDDLMDRMARKAVHHISSFRDAWSVLKS